VFAGVAGSGKSRAAAAVGRAYVELGLLSYGRLVEVSAMDLAGSTRAETGALLGGAATGSSGCVLMINHADAWLGLPDGGRHVLWELYKKLSEYRTEMGDELAVILAGDGELLRRLLYAAPPLAARFVAVIDFPGYVPAELTAILVALAADAGLRLTPEAERKAAALLAGAEAGPSAWQRAPWQSGCSTRSSPRRRAACSPACNRRIRPNWARSLKRTSPSTSTVTIRRLTQTGRASTCEHGAIKRHSAARPRDRAAAARSVRAAMSRRLLRRQ
jgi:hypothetical protein